MLFIIQKRLLQKCILGWLFLEEMISWDNLEGKRLLFIVFARRRWDSGIKAPCFFSYFIQDWQSLLLGLSVFDGRRCRLLYGRRHPAYPHWPVRSRTPAAHRRGFCGVKVTEFESQTHLKVQKKNDYVTRKCWSKVDVDEGDLFLILAKNTRNQKKMFYEKIILYFYSGHFEKKKKSYLICFWFCRLKHKKWEYFHFPTIDFLK